MNLGDATVFYVDDNPKAQRLLGDVLTARGFRVITASDPLEARASWKRLRFDLALLDYRMPFPTGSQLAKEIKSSAPNVPIVLISGYATLRRFGVVVCRCSLWASYCLGRPPQHHVEPGTFQPNERER